MLRKLRTWDFASKFVARSRKLKNGESRQFGVWTREQLISLGPTFVKLGQLASTRVDLYEPEFIEELAVLQDGVIPIPSEQIPVILENELKQPIHSVFAEFDYEPFKSASLGQVHTAVLSSGVPVVVKIQRPDVRDTIEDDINTITEILTIFDFLGVETGPSSKELFMDASEFLLNELDYTLEAQNAHIFYSNFYGTPWVRIPRVFREVLTPRLMVMERVDSTKITEISISKNAASQALVTSFLIQVMEHGFFHGDPHPGNVGISSRGELVYYDFGLMNKLPSDLKDGLTKIFPLLISRDTSKIVDILIEIGLIVPTAEKTEIALFFDAALDFLQKFDRDTFDARLAQDELSKSLASERPFLIPSNFLFLAKSLITIDGICRSLDPSFNFIAYIEPMIEDEIPQIDFSDITRTSIEMPIRVRTMSETVQNMERSRATIKRKLDKTLFDIENQKIGLGLAIVAETLHDYQYASLMCFVLSLFFIFRRR